jgi:glycine/D-amino acid oxidase-like deaminating enzyme/nitrite reductase/ring-hydroxylating ferredoxin subunit
MRTSAKETIDSNITSGENRSFWVATVEPIVFEKLQHEIDTDVLIVGGGIAGLTTAYCLLDEGLKVVVVEDGYIGSGESGRTSAHLSYALDDRFSEIGRLLGQQKARVAVESHMAAIQWIESTIMKEKIDCNFKRVPGYLFLSSNDKKESLEEEFEATKNIGLQTEVLDSIPGIKPLNESICIKFPDQGQFHIMKYLKGLANAVVDKGGQIYTTTKATDITKDGANANGYKIQAKHVVVATNTPVNDWVTMHTKQWPYRTYVIGAKIPKGSLPFSLWWDTGDPESKWISEPYHYMRLAEYDNEYDLLISGGEDHKVGQADSENIPEEDRYDKLYDWTKKVFPSTGQIVYKWSGQVMEPLDSMAFIGRNPGDDNVYIITGDSGNGLTHGTLGGILIKDLITGTKNQWEELYDPSRMVLKNAGDYLFEAGNMALQYTDWISKGDIKRSIDLMPGQGGIMTSGFKKLTVYRDENNNLHSCSAVCPHLGGILHWNADEKSFDCPVHGSRFTPDGKVINGPAASDLKKIEIRK